jgi:predicted glycosyltransferase
MTRFKSNPTRTLLLYAQDNRGLGHINRTLTIARHILSAYPTLVAYIATKSPIGSLFTLPKRCDYIKTPTRLTVGAVSQTEEEEEAAKLRFRRIRSEILREAVLGLAPELVLVDHEPLGSSGEFREGLYALKAQCPGTKFVFGMRDIMDDAARTRAQWRELGVYEAFEQVYDGIAVYGSSRLYDVAAAYALPESVRPKLHYCGYVVRDGPTLNGAAVRERHGVSSDAPLLFAAVGSGYDGFPVLEATVNAFEGLRGQFPGLQAILVTGPFMPADQQAVLRARAPEACRVLTQADNFELMGAADAVVGMGGYNSVCEALAVGRPLVIVPRATHKVEQQIRAETLAAQGLARWVHPKELNGETLADAVAWALRCDRRDHAARVQGLIPSFDGAVQLTRYVSRWLGAG